MKSRLQLYGEPGRWYVADYSAVGEQFLLTEPCKTQAQATKLLRVLRQNEREGFVHKLTPAEQQYHLLDTFRRGDRS
jgi:hypothetical protein